MALYESLTKSSTPEEIAAAYKEFTGTTGGDTKAAQEAAVSYLTNLGISAPTITAAYNNYLLPTESTGALPQTSTSNAYFQANPDVAAAYAQNTYGLTPEQFAQTHYQNYGQNEGRAAPTATTGALQQASNASSGTDLLASLAPLSTNNTTGINFGAINGVGGMPKGADLSKAQVDLRSDGYKYATSPGGIGQDAYYNNIRNFFTPTTGRLKTSSEIQDAMKQYGVSEADIKAATGNTLAELNPTLTYHTGKQYEGAQLYNLASQLAGITDTSNISGGVFGEKGASVGFNYDQAQKLLGTDASAYHQVLLDAAANLIDKGITDLSQLSGKSDADIPTPRTVIADANGQLYAVVPSGLYDTTVRLLTPEEAARVRTTRFGTGDSEYIQRQVDEIAKGSAIVGADGKVYSLGNVLDVGVTYTGPGGTNYQIKFDNQGKPHFYTNGFSTSDAGLISMIAAGASLAFPAAAPFIQGAMAVHNLSEGNLTGAALNALGAYGAYTGNELTSMSNPASSTAVSGLDLASDVATLGANPAVSMQGALANVNLAKTAIGGMNALQTGNMAGLVNSSLSGYTQMGGTLPSGLSTGVQVANLASAIDRGDAAGALNAAGDLSKSGDLKIAASGLQLVNAMNSGNPDALFGALTNFGKASEALNTSTVAKDTAGGITNRTYDETILDAGVKAFTDAKAIGASDEDAMAVANAATDSAMIDLANSSSTVSGSIVLTKDTEFGDLQGAIDKNVMDDAVRADKLDLIKNASTFGDAFAQARELLGPGKTFEWNGKQYSTATFAENPELSGNVISGGASTTAGGGRGSYAGYSSVEDAASKANLTTSKASELLNYINTQEETQYDALGNPIGGTAIAGAPDLNTTSGKIANGVANAMNTFFGVVANSPAAAVQAVGNLLSNAGGIIDLVAGESTDAGNKLRELSGQVDTFVQSVSDPKIKTQQAAIGDAVDKAEGIGGKTAALMSAAWDNPLGAANWILTEGFEEVPGVGLALKAGSKIARYGITIANDMMESGGSAYNDTYKAAIQQGMNEKDARDAARNSSLAAMAVTGITQGVVEGKVISKIAGKETAGEFTEGALQSGATQLALGQDLSLDKMLTQGVIEAAVGKGAQTTAEATTATNIDSDVFSTVAPGGSADTSKAGSGSSAVATDSVSGANLATDTGSTALSGSDSAVDASTGSGAGVETTTSVDADTGAETTTSVDSSTGLTTQSTTDANTGVTTSTTTDSNGNVTSTTQSSTDAKTGVKTTTTTDANTGATTNTSTDANTGVTTSTTTDSSGNVTSTTQSTTDSNTGVTTSTTTDANTGSTTNTSTDANTGVTTSTTTDSNGNVTSTSTTSVDANTGVKTETTTDSNTGSTTQTTTDSNTGVTTNTSVNTNTGVNTQTTVDSNTGVTTNVTTDSNTNVTTETKTDSNTNTTTIVQTDVDTNTQTTVVVDTNTGDIIDETETVVPDGWTPPVIETKKTDTTTTTSTITSTPATTPTVKASTPQESAPAMLAGAGFGAAGFDWGIDPRFLKSTVTGGAIDPLAAVKLAQAELERDTMMQNIDPRLMQILQDRMGGQPQAGQGALDQAALEASNEQAYYSYGSEDSIDDILGGSAANYKEGGYVAPLMMNSGGSMALPLLAKSGGALSGYQGRENFKDGKHVAGEGDGQSDDIPAWLADGEFVFPADVVSALGNGSTKAGTDKLYEMMHSIRDRARSTGREDLPPPALKSPLDYLKSSKRSK